MKLEESRGSFARHQGHFCTVIQGHTASFWSSSGLRPFLHICCNRYDGSTGVHRRGGKGSAQVWGGDRSFWRNSCYRLGPSKAVYLGEALDCEAPRVRSSWLGSYLGSGLGRCGRSPFGAVVVLLWPAWYTLVPEHQRGAEGCPTWRGRGQGLTNGRNNDSNNSNNSNISVSNVSFPIVSRRDPWSWRLPTS